MVPVGTLKVPELKARLAAAGLPRTGRKADLVARLLAAEGEAAAAAPDAPEAVAANYPVKIQVTALDQLATVEVAEGATYSLTLTKPLTQTALAALAASTLGHALEEIMIRPEYDDDNPSIIDTSECRFPKLKKLSLMFQAVKAVHFTAACFPALEELGIEQPCAEDPETFHLDLPALRHMSCQHVFIQDPKDFGPSLSRCPRLERFLGYKLLGLGAKAEHSLVLPSLTELSLYRSDDLRRLKLWAPRLESLSLQACYHIGAVTLLERRPARPAGPLYHFEGEPSEFIVNCMNTRVPKGNLVTSGRCREVIKNDGDDFF